MAKLTKCELIYTSLFVAAVYFLFAALPVMLAYSYDGCEIIWRNWLIALLIPLCLGYIYIGCLFVAYVWIVPLAFISSWFGFPYYIMFFLLFGWFMALRIVYENIEQNKQIQK